jgi:hypothetical protein
MSFIATNSAGSVERFRVWKAAVDACWLYSVGRTRPGGEQLRAAGSKAQSRKA